MVYVYTSHFANVKKKKQLPGAVNIYPVFLRNNVQSTIFLYNLGYLCCGEDFPRVLHDVADQTDQLHDAYILLHWDICLLHCPKPLQVQYVQEVVTHLI